LVDELLNWRHVFKLDPDRMIDDASLERLCFSGTDGIIVGGSTGVTYENSVDLLSRLRRYELPVVQEISAIDAVVPGFDGYLIPLVLNTRNMDWLTGHHLKAIRDFGDTLPWNRMLGEGYIILNPDSAAARVTEAYSVTSEQEVLAFSQMADQLLRLPIVYIEYSGIYGDMALVRRIHSLLRNARLFYGGGIDGWPKAAEALEAADTIVVGNLIYENLDRAIETVPIMYKDSRKEIDDE